MDNSVISESPANVAGLCFSAKPKASAVLILLAALMALLAILLTLLAALTGLLAGLLLAAALLLTRLTRLWIVLLLLVTVRVLVLLRGRVVAELARGEFTERELLSLAHGAGSMRDRTATATFASIP